MDVSLGSRQTGRLSNLSRVDAGILQNAAVLMLSERRIGSRMGGSPCPAPDKTHAEARMKSYYVAFVPDKIGYCLFSPDFSEVNSQGDSLEEAMKMAMDALRITVEEYEKEGREIPEPCDLETAKRRIEALLVDIDAKTHGETFFRLVPVARQSEVSSSRG